MKTLGILVALSAAVAVPAAAQNDRLKTARDLYASAAYDEALSELAKVERDRPTPAAALETDAYRAFCLIALGRGGEADTILESLVRKDPMLTVDRYPDVSPRIADQFSAVRRRLLPQLIREEYRTVRASAAENAPDALLRLTLVRDMLRAAKDIDAWDETLDDLRMLVDGFLDLTSRSAAAAASPTPPAPTPRAPAPPAEEPVATPSPAAPAMFDAGSQGVLSPVALSEQKLLMPRAVIDEAKRLKTKDGVRVKYVKTIAVTPYAQ